MDYQPLNYHDVLAAQQRISPYIHRTPLLMSSLLNQWVGHRIIFKAEGMQKMGAFKIRGALNSLLQLKEQQKLPEKVVAFSSGNHAQAVAASCKMLGIEATIIMPTFASAIKRQATESYGALMRLTQTRQEAEALAHQLAEEGYYLLPPYDHDGVIAGQSTACLEVIQDGIRPDAIFATTSGGGLISGTWLAAHHHGIAVYGGEPMLANDASVSYRSGSIVTLADTPMTIADGARSLSLSPRTFHYVQQLAGIYEVSEQQIIYWTQWLQHVLKIMVEPTAAVAMAASMLWLEQQSEERTVVVILSGANVSPESYRQIWQENYLHILPNDWSII